MEGRAKGEDGSLSLEDYALRSLIRARSGHQLIAASAPSGAPRVLLLADEGVASGWVESIAAAHARIDSPHVPRVLATSLSPRAFLVFESAAVMDLETLHPLLRAREAPLAYSVGVAFNEALMDAADAAHDVDEQLGALAWANVLVGAAGEVQLIGFGANLWTSGLDGRFLGAPGQAVAPEVSIGHEVTPSADVFAVHSLVLGLFALSEPPDVIGAALRTATESPLGAGIVQLSRDALMPSVALRTPDIRSLREGYRALRRIAPEIPVSDPAALRAAIASLVRAHRGLEAREGLRLGLRTREVTAAPEVRFSLARRQAPWRILVALARAHLLRPGARLSLDALQQAGWPGEKLVHESARARVYVAISNLRKLGLGEVLVSEDGGYGFEPELAVHLDPEAEI